MTVACAVPFCRRHAATVPAMIVVQVGVERVDVPQRWICREHWRSISRRLRAATRKAARRFEATGSLHDAALASRLGDHCIRKAIERAAGIG